MSLIYICKKLEELIGDMHDANDPDNIKRQLEMKIVPLKEGGTKKVVALKPGSDAYKSIAAFFKVKSDVVVDSEGNVYFPENSIGGSDGVYHFVRKISQESTIITVQKIMQMLGENYGAERHQEMTRPQLIHDARSFR